MSRGPNQPIDAMAQQAYWWNPWAMPAQPTYQPSYDPLSMGMEGQVDQRLAQIRPDQRGIQAFRQQALRTGPSAWSTLARRQQAALAGNAREQGAKALAGRRAAAEGQLAMRGGLTGGARERLAKSSLRDYFDMSQGVANQQQQNALQIDVNDEANRIQQLGMLPGMENQALQPEFDKLRLWGQAREIDTKNRVQENRDRNMFNLERYKEQMGGWAAGRQARATENSGKK